MYRAACENIIIYLDFKYFKGRSFRRKTKLPRTARLHEVHTNCAPFQIHYLHKFIPTTTYYFSKCSSNKLVKLIPTKNIQSIHESRSHETHKLREYAQRIRRSEVVTLYKVNKSIYYLHEKFQYETLRNTVTRRMIRSRYI